MKSIASAVFVAVVFSTSVSAQPASTLRGDANDNLVIEPGDIFYLINHVFAAGTAPARACLGDANSDELVTVSDVTFLIDHLYAAGAAPVQAIEICNGKDDDCDGAIDEGSACGAPGPAWLLSGNASTEAGHFLGTADASPFVVKTAGVERMRVSAAGNVGIGTSDPQSALQIAGGYLHLPVSNGALELPDNCDETVPLTGRAFVSHLGNFIFVCMYDNWSTIALNAGSPAMISESGERNAQDASVVGDTSKWSPPIVPAAGPAPWWQLDGNAAIGATGFLGTTDANPVVFKTAGAERMRVTSTGSIGIDLAEPESALQVLITNNVNSFVQFPTAPMPGPPSADQCDSVLEAGRTVVNVEDKVLDVCDGSTWRRTALCRGYLTLEAKFRETLLGTFYVPLIAPIPQAQLGNPSAPFGTGVRVTASATGVSLSRSALGFTVTNPFPDQYRFASTMNASTPSALKVDYAMNGIKGSCNYQVGGQIYFTPDYIFDRTIADGPRDRFELADINFNDYSTVTFSGCSTMPAEFHTYVREVITNAILQALLPQYATRCVSCETGYLDVCPASMQARQSSGAPGGSEVRDDAVTGAELAGAPAQLPSKVNALAASEWLVTGNAQNTVSNFIGTTDAKPLIVRTNGLERMRITENGFVGIGTATPQSALQVAAGYIQLSTQTIAGAPAATDCDSASEMGRIIVNTAEGALYVCSSSGWKWGQ